MRIFLTGATGFVGSFLAEKLVKDGHELAILTRKTSNPWRIKSILPYVQVIYGDLVDCKNFETEFIAFDPEIIYHVGWIGVENSQRNNPKQIKDNIESTLSLISLIEKCNVRTVVALGSQAEYGPKQKVISEDCMANPTTLYGVAKLSSYHLFNYYLAQRNIRFAWLRLFSSFGPKDNPNWLIPYMIRQLSKGISPNLTKAEQIWDYIYIDDVVSAIISVGNSDIARGIYNLGSGVGYPLKNIFEVVRKKVNPEIQLNIGAIPYRPDQVMVLQADVTKLALDTGWYPKVSIDDGINKTIEWFETNTCN